jgi:hypothetical protein
MPTSAWHRAGSAAAVIILVVTADARSASSQSLGDLARRTEADRKQATAGRVYTNDVLEAVDPPPASPAEPAATPAAAVPGSKVEKDPTTGQANVKPPTQAREKRDEQYWRKLFTDLRANVARANADLDAERARLDAFRGDESPAGVRQREVLAASIARLENGARIQTEELTRYLARATRAKVPEEWTR